MKRKLIHLISIAVFSAQLFFLNSSFSAISIGRMDSIQIGSKDVYLPTEVWRVPENNDYENPESEYSNTRRVESANIVLFWAKEYGDQPMHNNDEAKRFDPEAVLKTCEDLYQFYTKELKFVEEGNSISDRYKLLMYVFGGDDGTAYGGGAADKIGVMWTPAARIKNAPYGALAHEMGHSFQYLAKCDGNWAYSSPIEGSRGNSIFEMTSQYMLWQVYPDWITFENYHLKGFMEKTHYAFLHEENQYHSPFVLEYWASKHGKDFIGKMWRSAQKGEDPVMTYKRLAGLSQEHFNDELFDAYRRFVTWDMARIESVSRQYANQHFTKLDALPEQGWRISADKTPQNYGYNAIRLHVPTGENREIELTFNGKKGLAGYRTIHPEEGGWRYGFLAVSKAGLRTYGPVYKDDNATVAFSVPDDTAYLWLVVMGAPKIHRSHLIDGKDETDEQWPYEIVLKKTNLFNE
ncbi:DUF6055 domain-containing protein [Sphingobacterium sp. LRF_L2]|uniref:DUF6055 domain-containing protein n=1 Tax=Sphingobacterium sp. LRF_L2 TaxID=3369421 RepID=UPI003F620872